ncbi:MAG: nucleotidyltransferase domain-containing protein [Candidatus Bathycorpusculaceae bacterium]
MRLREKHTLDLNNIVNVISEIRGVVGIILFGSIARGEEDEYSDYDLLVLFEDKASMWQKWDNLFQATSNLEVNLHLIPETLEELQTANPVFLHKLQKHGRVLFAKFPFEVFSKPLELKPFCLIVYDMRRLSYRDKMKATYFLYKKNNKGAVAHAGGIKINGSCILVPNNESSRIINALESLSVSVTKLEIYIAEDNLKELLDKETMAKSKNR